MKAGYAKNGCGMETKTPSSVSCSFHSRFGQMLTFERVASCAYGAFGAVVITSADIFSVRFGSRLPRTTCVEDRCGNNNKFLG